ncbi:MAG: class I SAM-dependent methyltransferase [Acidimicrobiia bacterium]|nr:class I SAM-dependent methyltransferase [Acidimicrobiia bacterium]
MSYDPQQVTAYFNRDPAVEWARLSESIQGRIKHAIHLRAIERAVDECGSAEPLVLDVGSGPGRFAIDALRLGCRLVVTDVSEGQLDEARRRIADAGLLDGVIEFAVRDVLDLSAYPDDSFDVVLCLGGPVSYVRDQHPRALSELIRVTRARLVVSVMGLYGSLRLAGPLDEADALAEIDRHLPIEEVLAGAGSVPTRPMPDWHLPMTLFTSEGLRSAIEAARGRVVEMASANPLVPEFLGIPEIESNLAAERNLTDLEVRASTEPGLRDTGEHLIAVAEPA